jgi:hypothetical protein
MEATMQSMERHLAGVGGDGDGMLGAEGGSSKPSVKGNTFFGTGCGNLCSGVRRDLGEPDVLVCSGDLLHVADSPRALHTVVGSGARGAGKILGGGGNNFVAGGSSSALTRGVNHHDADDVVLHTGGIDRALAQDPDETSVSRDGAPGGGSDGPDAIWLLFRSEPSRAGFTGYFSDRTLTPLLIKLGQRHTTKLALAAGGASGGGVGLGAGILADGPCGLCAGVLRDGAGGLNSEPPSDLQSSLTPARSPRHCRACMCGLSDSEADRERPGGGNLNASILGAVGACSGRGRDSDDAHGGSSGMIPVMRSPGGDALNRGSSDAENGGRGLPTSSGNDVWGTGNNDNIVIPSGDPVGMHDDSPLGQHRGGCRSAGSGRPAAHGGNTLNASSRLPPSWAHSLAG